jgi:Protein of unknown function (DUF2975)
MKNFKFSFIALLVTISIFLFCYVYFTYGKVASNSKISTVSLPNNDTAFGGIFSTFNLSDSLPNYEYKKLEDNFKRKKDYQTSMNDGNYISCLFIGSIGFSAELLENINYVMKSENDKEEMLKKMDSIIIFRENEKDDLKKQELTRTYDSIRKILEKETGFDLSNENRFSGKSVSYFSLKNYKLDEENKFFLHNGKYNLAFVKWKGEDSLKKIGYYDHKEINIRYKKSNGSINIPISNKLHTYLKFLLMVTISLVSVASFYFFIGLPFQIFLNISRGNVFVNNNLKYLNQICAAAIIGSTIALLLPMLLHFIFMSKIPPEISPQSFLTIIQNMFGYIVACIILLLIRKAFKAGYDLKEENALTV